MTDRDLLEVASRNYRDLTEAVASMWEAEMTDRDLLEVASRNYRDLTEAVAAMWEHAQPHLTPGTVPDLDHSQTQPSPVQDLELMTQAIVESLRRV